MSKTTTKLLTIEADPKTVKGEKAGYMTAVMYLIPADGASAETLCPMAELAKCKAPCLLTAGRGGMAAGNATFTTPSGTVLPDNAVQHARLRRTEFFLTDQQGFMEQLVAEIHAFIKRAERAGLLPAVRLNGTSDIRWEDVRFSWAKAGWSRSGAMYTIFEMFPDIQFYDYTKIPNRYRALRVPNYHLTFSYSHVPEFAPIVAKALQTYGDRINYAVVFSTKRGRELPEVFLGRHVVDGDDTDLRFLDARRVVVGLRAKGRARKDASGFVVMA